MRKIVDAIVPVGAAVAVMAALCAQPAAAGEASSGAKEESRASHSAAMAGAPKSRTGHVRKVRGYPARFAALASQDCGRFSSPCQRPVVLILGIGF